MLWACCRSSETNTVLLGTEFSVNEWKLAIYTVQRKRRKGGETKVTSVTSPGFVLMLWTARPSSSSLRPVAVATLYTQAAENSTRVWSLGPRGRVWNRICPSAEPVLLPLYQRERRQFQSSLLRPAPPSPLPPPPPPPPR